ncbi:MAG: OmpA family protein [Cryomorphaceae bacterium]
MFSSNREHGERLWNSKEKQPRNDFDLYRSAPDTIGDIQVAENLGPPFNTSQNEGSITFNEARDIAIFSRSYTNQSEGEGQRLGLFQSELVNGAWTEPQPFWFNHQGYSVQDPALSPDGSMLFFASDMPGGFGGFDIYFVKQREHQGGWAFPINSGRTINTEGDELTPFYHTTDSLLFFASDGQLGIGGLDLFVAKKDGNRFINISNLGLPFNSRGDDFALITNPRRTSGYFTSDRGGRSGGNDLFHFLRIAEEEATGFKDPLDAEPILKNRLSYASGQGDIGGQFLYRKVAQENVYLNLYNSEGRRIGAATTDSAGKFVFTGLNFYDSYIIKLDEDQDGLFGQSTIFFLDNNGNKVDSARTLFFNAFSFQYLPKEYAFRPTLVADDPSDLVIKVLFTHEGVSQAFQDFELSSLDGVIDTLTTDSFGFIEIPHLRHRQHCKLTLLSEGDLTLEKASLEIVGFDKEVLAIAKKIPDFQFQFTALRKLDFNNVARYEGRKSNMFGRFVIDKKGKDGVVISLFDTEGNYVSTTTTDSTGEFIFDDLEYLKQYKLKLAEAYSDLFKDGKIYLLNEERKAIDSAGVFRFNEYAFVHLPEDVSLPLTLLEEQDTGAGIEGFYAVHDVPIEGERMMLSSKNGVKLDKATTSINGQFEFKDLLVDEEYILTLEDSLHLNEAGSVYIVSDSNAAGEEVQLGKGGIVFKSGVSGSRLSAEPRESFKIFDLKGVFEHDSEALEGAELALFDEDGVRVKVTTIKADGSFIFKDFDYYGTCIIRLGPKDQSLFEDGRVFISETKDHAGATATTNNFNEYRFVLSPSLVKPRLEHMDEEDQALDLTTAVNGVLKFDKFPTVPLKLVLSGQDKLPLDTVDVFRNGLFSFSGLVGGQQYFISTESGKAINSSAWIWELSAVEDGASVESRKSSADTLMFVAPHFWKGSTQEIGATQAGAIRKQSFEPIYFDFSSHTIDQATKVEMDRLVRYLAANEQLRLEIKGFSDSRGGEEFNLMLSQARADAVADYLHSQGIARSRIESHGFGEEDLLNKCSDGVPCSEEEHKVNRRTEFSIF